jgi:predicted HicB family RNase H-like nuclease
LNEAKSALETYDQKIEPIRQKVKDLTDKLARYTEEIQNLKKESQLSEDKFTNIVDKVCEWF